MNEIFDSMKENNLTPADFITLMFERTDEDGVLYIPGWHYDGPGWVYNVPGSTDENDSYRCRVNWNIAKYEKLLEKFNKHLIYFQEIAQLEKQAEREGKPFVLEGEHLEFWNTYLKPFDVGDIDRSKIADIEDRLEMVEFIKKIALDISNGDEVMDFEKETLTEYIDVKVTPEEREYLDKYHKAIHKDSEARIGNNICAYDVIIRSMRLCRLIYLNAPPIIVNNEARELAASMLLHDYGVSKEVVDNSLRMRLEKMEQMSEEELDELYRPKKANTRKSLAPLFVYEILTKKSSVKNHLRQQDILKELEMYPYEIRLERKALSRIIHNLADSGYDIQSDKTGVWKE